MILNPGKRARTLVIYFYLLLFAGYYGSISFFYHSHIILGDSIVHSHPYKSDKNNAPLHSHSERGYVTIQLLSDFVATAVILTFTVAIYAPELCKLVMTDRKGSENTSLHYSYSLRAPPSIILI